MGQQIPQTNNQHVKIKQRDEFEAKFVQRVKETPFIDCEIYTTNPFLFIDPTGPSLIQLVKPRLGTKQLFPQQEIQKTIVNILTGLCQLQQNGFEGHGDVCLQTIYYSQKDKSFKLRHPIFSQQSGYLLAFHGKRFSALAPEQLYALEQGSQNSESSFKSDIFSFGISLCQVCTLIQASDIYCPDTYSIFHLEIEKRLKIIEQYYSKDIVELIARCLNYDPEERLNPKQLLAYLSQLKKNKNFQEYSKQGSYN